jgi:dihydroorotase-like cyclic amidohydrolase
MSTMSKVTAESLRFKNKVSPYVGKTLIGRVEQTYLGGTLVYDRMNIESIPPPPVGCLIR